MLKKLILPIAVFLLLSACSQNKKTPTVIGFQSVGRGGTYLIDVEIGKERHKARFLLDTGSEITALDAEFAKKIGVKVTGTNEVEGGYSIVKYEKSEGNLLVIGQEKLEGITFTLLSLGEETNELGESYRVDGIIGADIMKRFTFGIDFDSSQLTLYGKEMPYSTEGYAEIPFRHTGDYFPRIQIKTTFTNGEELSGEVFFDLGAVNTLLFNTPFAQTQEIVKKAPTHVLRPANDVSGEETFHEVIRLKTLSIAGYDMHTLPVDISTSTHGVSGYPGYMGMLGAMVMSRFNFIVDTDKGKIYLKPNNHFSQAFEFPLTTLPVQMQSGKMLMIQDVKANNANDETIRKGSEILSVDGQAFPNEMELWNYMYKQNGIFKLEIKNPSGQINTLDYNVVEMI